MQRDMDNNAVSPVIGVILMVAITVVLAAIVFVVVSQLGGQVDVNAPRINVQSNGGGLFTILHADASIAWNDLQLTDGCMPSMTAGDVLAGQTIQCESDALTITHLPTNTIVYQH